MNRALVSFFALGLAFFAAACSSDEGGSNQQTGSGGGQAVGSGGGTAATGVGGGVVTSGGSVGSGAGTGLLTGGTAGMGGSPVVTGGTSGNTGGVSVGNTGGITGGNTGGLSGGNTGGISGGNTGGASGATGGVAGGNTGGDMGETGGSTGETGGSAGAGGGASTTGGEGGGSSETGGTSGEGTGGSVGDPTGGNAGQATGGVVEEPELITSSQGAFWQEGTLTEGGGSPTVTVNDSQEEQDWHGFGGTFNEAGWDALKALSNSADRDLAIRLLFSSQEGCGFTFGRIPIGSSDYGLDRYSLNETAGDYAMENFSIERDRQDLIPYIKAALAVKPDIKFWGSPWSPPTWMKDNGAFDRGNMKSDAQTLDAHALYLARFVEEYALEGIDVLAVHPQNEPGFTQDYPSCAWSASTMTTHIGNHLGPLFAERLPGVEVWLGTISNTSSVGIINSVMGDGNASQYVKGIGLQWGMVDQIGSAHGHNVPIMQTEHKCGNYPWLAGYQQVAPNDYAYAQEGWGLIKQWIEAGVNSYLAWNMILDTGGRSLDTVRPWSQNALITVDRSSGTLNITPTYYVFRHFAQYVEPGAKRVATSGGDAVAFKNPDGSIVTVIYNQGGATTMTLSVGGTNVQFDAPGNGWATVNWQG